jgi:hypothetical protein
MLDVSTGGLALAAPYTVGRPRRRLAGSLSVADCRRPENAFQPVAGWLALSTSCRTSISLGAAPVRPRSTKSNSHAGWKLGGLATVTLIVGAIIVMPSFLAALDPRGASNFFGPGRDSRRVRKIDVDAARPAEK